ncbi:MAG: DNA primase [Cyanosarcina radialis HA8281-LM2]|jgi:DNA primase|nr:DNA primase [Cyanosarcina radialis HA8281-LM2]
MQSLRLHPDTIEQVKQRADIVDVVAEQVVLRKRGKDYVGLCPFHDEKTPSFTVSPNKQMYYCFGCQAGGNAIAFLMELGKQSFSDAVLDLARRYQIPVKTLEPEQQQEWQRQQSLREQLYEILALATRFYEHVLRQPEGKSALEYLQTERQLSAATIQQFQLGYAPNSWETLYKYLVEQKRYSAQLVEQTGLIAPRKPGGGYYDRFRDRLMIPICDLQGRVIGFGGRILSAETQNSPKYLNSPETELFDKGKTLFALDRAKETISKEDRAIVVEGYFDAIALHAAGITNVVASLGTALSLNQVRQLLRYTESKQIILNFDADKAGKIAAERAIGEIATLAYQGQVQLRILNLPDGKDADEFLKGRGGDGEMGRWGDGERILNSTLNTQHSTLNTPDTTRHFTLPGERYRELVANAPLWLDWQIQQTLVDRDLALAEQFQAAAKAMVKLLSRLEDANTYTHYLQQCAQHLSKGNDRLVPLVVENLQTQVKRLKRSAIGKDGKSPSLPGIAIETQSRLLDRAEELLLRIYLHCPEHRQEMLATLLDRDLLCHLQHQFLWQQLLAWQEAHPDSGCSADELFSLLQAESIDLDRQIAKLGHLFHLDEKQQQEIGRSALVMRASIAAIEMVQCEQQRRYCLQKWLDPATPAQDKDFYHQQFYSAQQRLRQLDSERQFKLLEVI